MADQTLFGENLSSQDYVESKLKCLYPVMWLAVTESLEHVLDRRAENDRAFIHTEGDALAVWLRPQIAWRATELIKKYHPDAVVRQPKCGTQQMFTVVVDDVAVSFKKLNDDLRRSNYYTRNQATYWRQAQFVGSLSHRVIFGYQLKNSETEAAMYLTMPHGRRNAWVVPILDQAEAAAHMRSVAAEHGRVAEERKGFRVSKIPKKDVAGGAG